MKLVLCYIHYMYKDLEMGLEQGGGERMVLVLTKACRIDEWEMVVLIMETEWLGEE